MKNLVVIVLILIAGAGAVYFTGRGPLAESEAAPSAGTSPLDQDYDYYVQNMRTTRFGTDGQPVSQLQAARVTHYPDSDRAELLAPSFKSFGDESGAWEVSAEAGTLAPDVERMEDRLELQGDVHLYEPRPRDDFVDVRTSRLTVFPTAEEVVNTVPVTFQTRDSRFEVMGMRALLAEDYIQLNEGNGSHDPKPLP